MKRSENAIVIYKSLYMNSNEDTVEDVHDRVATCISENQEQYNKFKNILDSNTFRPNSPCLINSWKTEAHKNKYNGNLVACYVVGLDDNMDSIIDLWNTCATVYAGGGGTGFCISNLREANAPISIGGVASGPIEYLKVIQSISDTVKSGGKARRAANLSSFWYKHPDILEYIECKKNHNFSAINISVLINDEFMQLVDSGRWDTEIKLQSPNSTNITKTITVKEIWDKIIENAWASGDPGLLFYDTINNYNPLPSRGDIRTSNPCGEVPLASDSCCDLGSLNLNKFLVETESDDRSIVKYKFDFESFKCAIRISIEFLDQVIDNSTFPNARFEKTMTETRPLGLGLMGWADILYKLKISYGSTESLSLFKEICRTLTATAFEHSIDLAEKKGAIDLGDDVQHFTKLLHLYEISPKYLDKFERVGIRNSNVTSLAPTGSISISAECCYAFEPMMALVWEKPLQDRNKTLKFVNDEFINVCKSLNIDVTDDLMDQIISNKGSIQNIDIFPQHVKNVFVTAHDIGWSKKIEMQAVGQKYISLAISSTCNLPNSATKLDVEKAYIKAWSLGLKGITIYRDGSLTFQPVNFGKVDDANDEVYIDPKIKAKSIKLPIKRSGETVKFRSPHGSVYITCNKLEGEIIELFLSMGKSGQLESLLIKNLSKQISKSLHHRVPIDVILDQMEGEGGHPFWFKLDEDKNINVSAESVLDAIAKMIRYHFMNNIVDGYSLNNKEIENVSNFDICPVCRNRTLQRSSGCKGGSCIDPQCGFSACG